MRVIAGSAKGHKLQSVPGDSTRPITDRAKEALFSILGDWLIDIHVLDMFAGTGAVGIECLSRGSDRAVFVDRERKAIRAILANLEHCKLADRAVVKQADTFRFVREYRGEPFDLVFIAPPQYKGTWKEALVLIDQSPHLLTEFATVIVQIHPQEDEPVELEMLEEYDRRQYGSVLLLFYASSEALDAEESDAESLM
jgi:16S rRNA (guanine966-N2)-methyltransferase